MPLPYRLATELTSERKLALQDKLNNLTSEAFQAELT